MCAWCLVIVGGSEGVCIFALSDCGCSVRGGFVGIFACFGFRSAIRGCMVKRQLHGGFVFKWCLSSWSVFSATAMNC